jgi:hypothetical protein
LFFVYGMVLGKVRGRAAFVHAKFRDHASTAIIAAFSFLIGLSWKDFIVKVVQENIPLGMLEGRPYLVELWTAVVITVIAIVGIALVSEWAQKEDPDELASSDAQNSKKSSGRVSSKMK